MLRKYCKYLYILLVHICKHTDIQTYTFAYVSNHSCSVCDRIACTPCIPICICMCVCLCDCFPLAEGLIYGFVNLLWVFVVFAYLLPVPVIFEANKPDRINENVALQLLPKT